MARREITVFVCDVEGEKFVRTFDLRDFESLQTLLNTLGACVYKKPVAVSGVITKHPQGKTPAYFNCDGWCRIIDFQTFTYYMHETQNANLVQPIQGPVPVLEPLGHVNNPPQVRIYLLFSTDHTGQRYFSWPGSFTEMGFFLQNVDSIFVQTQIPPLNNSHRPGRVVQNRVIKLNIKNHLKEVSLRTLETFTLRNLEALYQRIGQYALGRPVDIRKIDTGDEPNSSTGYIMPGGWTKFEEGYRMHQEGAVIANVVEMFDKDAPNLEASNLERGMIRPAFPPFPTGQLKVNFFTRVGEGNYIQKWTWPLNLHEWGYCIQSMDSLEVTAVCMCTSGVPL